MAAHAGVFQSTYRALIPQSNSTLMPLAISLIFSVAYVVFGAVGFGSGLVAMPLLSPLVGIETAAPLFAITALIGEIIMLMRYRDYLNLRGVWRLVLATTIAAPFGIAIAHVLNENTALLLLGVVVTGYGLYSLISPRIPEIKNPNWAFGFGFIGGLLGGAYNTGGPPVVIYGSMSRWTPGEFKSSLQSVFIINSIIVFTIHAASGHVTANVLQDSLFGVPATLIGLVVGWQLEKHVNPAQFRRLVLVLLVIIGLRLIMTNWPGVS
jgi:uncharacterized protein